MIKNILVFGALSSEPERVLLYEAMVEVCSGYAEEVSSPIDTAQDVSSGGSRYERALAKVRRANILVGEQSEPSTGQGMEIGYSLQFSKPIIVVAKRGSKVSGLMKGCPNVKDIVYYDSLEDLKVKLGEALGRVVDKFI